MPMTRVAWGSGVNSSRLPIGVGRLTFELEVAGPEAYDRLVEALLAAGMHRGAQTDLATSAAAAMPT